jgi:hypothetical protein
MSTYSFNLTADQMVKKALQLTGVLGLGRTPKPEHIQDGREILSEILKTLQARGTTLTQMVRSTLTLIPGQASYVLPSNVIDIEAEPTMVQQPGTTTETWVDRMSYSDWRIISDKSVSGLPTRVFVEMGQIVTAFFWSVPDQAYTWNYRAFQLLPDMTTGGQLTELTQRWMGALTWRLAYWLTFPLNVPQARRSELMTEAEKQEAIVMGQESERGDIYLELPRDPYTSSS